MTINQRSRVAIGGAFTLTVLALAVPLPAAAAPYTADASVQVSSTNPPVGGQLTLTVRGFTSGETVVFELHSTVYHLGNAVVNTNGDASLVAQLPPGVACQHFITATSPSDFARTDIVIGPPEACTRGGNTGNGNSGNGNTGNGNTGNGNTGNGNSGNGNTGNGNSSGYGYGGDDTADTDGWGNVSYARATTSAPQRHASEVALVSIAGLTIVAGAGFLQRRRRTS